MLRIASGGPIEPSGDESECKMKIDQIIKISFWLISLIWGYNYTRANFRFIFNPAFLLDISAQFNYGCLLPLPTLNPISKLTLNVRVWGVLGN